MEEIIRLERNWQKKTGINYEILNIQTHEFVLEDIIINQGMIPQYRQHYMMEVLTGGRINEELTDTQQRIIKRTLMAHLMLLIYMIIPEDPHEYDKTTIPYKGDKLQIVTQDLEQGKLVARIVKENKIWYTNIRHLIESLTLTQLTQYNIGLGSATHRTQAQKQKAQEYVKKVINEAKGIKIFPDGSIDPRGKKITQECGGYGLVIIDQQQKVITQLHNKVKTKDSQITEIEGVTAAMEWINNNKHKIKEQNYNILCDCKNVVNYINQIYATPYKYAEKIQKIKQLMTAVQNHGSQIILWWIPGHTDNKWNDIADALAKRAAAQ